MVPKRRCSPTLRGMVVSNQLDKTEKKKLCKLKGSLSRDCQVHFMILLQIQDENNFLPNSEYRKAKVRRFIGIFCTTASFIAQISSSENVSTASWFRSQNSE